MGANIPNRHANIISIKIRIKEKYIFLLFFCLSFLTQIGFTQPFSSMPWIKDTVYIDPNYSGNQSGSIEEPYNSIGFEFLGNKAYLFKRGTILETKSSLIVKADSIYIGAYGNGAKPLISPNSTSKHLLMDGTHQVLQNLHIKGLDDSTAVVCDFRSSNNGYNWADNLEIEHGYRGLNASDNSKIVISNTRIHDIRDDGMYTSKNDTIIIDGVEIWDINRNYLVKPDITYAGGDCIQGQSNGYVHIKNSVLDHSQIGGKFALIQNGTDTLILENTVLFSHDSSSAAYLGASNYIDGCEVIGGLNGLWLHGSALIQNSVFRGQTGNAITGGPANIYFCDFINQENNAIKGYSGIEFIVRNSIFHNVYQAYAAEESKVTASHNNYFNPSSTNIINQWGDNNLEFDPLFQNPASSDFKLKPQSPLINMGLDFSFVRKDFLLQQRKNGLAPDIGAIEYYSSTAAINSAPIPFLVFDHAVTSGFIGEVDASLSYDYNSDNLNYLWETEASNIRQYSGNRILKFIAPAFEESKELEIRLNLSDEINSRERNITIAVLPYKPEANVLDIVKASSESFADNFGPENVIDSSIDTYWIGSKNRDEITLELKVPAIIDFIRLSAFLSYGEEQVFNIYGSHDNSEWQLLGNKYIHSGLSDEFQVLELSDTIQTAYKYVKLSAIISSPESFKKVNEIKIYGKEKPIDDNVPLSLFPLPAHDFAVLRVLDLTMVIAYLKVYDLNGKEVLCINEPSSIGDIRIPLGAMTDGLYNIHVKTKKGDSYNKKLIVLKPN